MKTLFPYTKREKESVEDYSRNLTSLWDTAKAIGASPGIHRGLVEGWLFAKPGHIADVNNITDIERTEAETQTSDAVKAALLISGAEKRRYGGLKNDLGNNYIMGTDKYPDTTEKARGLLGNYKHPRLQQFHQPRDDGGVAFIQRGRGDSVVASTSSRIPSSSLDEGISSIIYGLTTLLLTWRFIVPQ